ncbi:unnamed protein product [Schistosoma turkestanicum]|nr:unnamed protein product [Schistosoma turkestanicum]
MWSLDIGIKQICLSAISGKQNPEYFQTFDITILRVSFLFQNSLLLHHSGSHDTMEIIRRPNMETQQHEHLHRIIT